MKAPRKVQELKEFEEAADVMVDPTVMEREKAGPLVTGAWQSSGHWVAKVGSGWSVPRWSVGGMGEEEGEMCQYNAVMELQLMLKLPKLTSTDTYTPPLPPSPPSSPPPTTSSTASR